LGYLSIVEHILPSHALCLRKSGIKAFLRFSAMVIVWLVKCKNQN